MLTEVKNDLERTYQKRLEDLQKKEIEAADHLQRKRHDINKTT